MCLLWEAMAKLPADQGDPVGLMYKAQAFHWCCAWHQCCSMQVSPMTRAWLMAAVLVQLACSEGGGDGQATAFIKSWSALLEDSWAQWSPNQAGGSRQLGF